MKELTLYYSVQNGGDGSAYPSFMESMKLAEWDQEHMDEGWGEPCTGSITLKSESPIICDENIITKEGYYLDIILDNYYAEGDPEDFYKKFFPDGFPKVEVIIGDESHYHVLCEGKVIYKEFSWSTANNEEVPATEERRQIFENKLKEKLKR